MIPIPTSNSKPTNSPLPFYPTKVLINLISDLSPFDFYIQYSWKMLGSGLNLVTTVIGFGMSATFIVFICARLLCGRIRSTDSRDATAVAIEIQLRSDLARAEHTITGLQPYAIAAIPTMKYDREAFPSREDAQCSICLGDYQEKEILRMMPTCHHNFHLACIDEWLKKKCTCPICRLPLNDSIELSPAFGLLQEIGSTLVSTELSNQWLQLPNHHHRSDGSMSNHEIHDSISTDVEASHGEPEVGS